MVEPFSNEFSFRILTSTRDRDVFEEAPYPNIKFNKWNKVGTIEDLCCQRNEITIFHLGKLMELATYDILSELYT